MNGFFLEFTSPKEEAATAITPSQPSREVNRDLGIAAAQDYLASKQRPTNEGASKYPGPVACVIAFLIAIAVAVFAAPVLGKSIANVAHYNAHHIDRGAW